MSVLVYYALRACSFCQFGSTARRRQHLLLKRWPLAEHLGKMVSRRALHALWPLCDLTSACVFVCVCVYANACARVGTMRARVLGPPPSVHSGKATAATAGHLQNTGDGRRDCQSCLRKGRAAYCLEGTAPRRGAFVCTCVCARARWTVCVCVRARDGDSEFSRHEHSADTQRVCVGCQACDKIWSHVVENIDSLWAHA